MSEDRTTCPKQKKMIGTKQIVTGKQRKIVLYLVLFAFVLKLHQIKHHLNAALVGLFVWSPKNDYVGQVVQYQNSTMAKITKW